MPPWAACSARRSALLALVLLAGCGSGDDAPFHSQHRIGAARAHSTRTGADRDAHADAGRRVAASPWSARAAPPDAANCAAVTGSVLYVEASRPGRRRGRALRPRGRPRDGARGGGVDVARDLRPRRLPRTGDVVSAAGPVYTGSYGQQQIEAVELHLRRR